MNFESILVEITEGVALVTINRPKALNALNRTVLTELTQFFQNDIKNIPGCKGVILKGAGEKAFVAGADITEFAELKPENTEPFIRLGNDLFRFIEHFPKPVIAVVHGFALGGGCELAMACHMRIISDKARIGQPEVNLGLLPGYGGTQRLAHLIGKAKALELLLTGDMLGADETLRLGWANHLVPVGEEVAKATEIINKISKKAPLAIAKVIDAVNAGYEDGANGHEREIEHFVHLTGTSDFKEGAAAFVEKRKANFTGK